MTRCLKWNWFGKGLRAAAILAVLGAGAPDASAGCTYCISEIFFNPPNSNDESNGDEYVEVLGPASTQWTNKHLLFLENEDSATNAQIEAGFNLSSITGGSDGYILFTMYGHSYSPINGGATHITPNGTSTQNEGFESPYVAWSGTDYAIENSGFTALLVETDGDTPSIGFDMDGDNDGDVSDTLSDLGWTLLDSIGVIGESDELDSKLFSSVNFGGGALDTGNGGAIPSGASYTDVEDTLDDVGGAFTEIEWIGRQGIEVDEIPVDIERDYLGTSWIAANLKLINSPDEFGVAGGEEDYEAVLGRASGSGVGTQHWSEDFVVTDTMGSPNHTPEPGSLALISLGLIGLLGFGRQTRD